MEAPNTQGQHHAGIVKNIALSAHILYMSAHLGLRAEFVNLRHAKLILTDNGNAKKPEMIDRAEFMLGLPAGTLTEHEADAYGLWLVRSFGVPQARAEREKDFRARKRAEKEAAKQIGSLL